MGLLRGHRSSRPPGCRAVPCCAALLTNYCPLVVTTHIRMHVRCVPTPMLQCIPCSAPHRLAATFMMAAVLSYSLTNACPVAAIT